MTPFIHHRSIDARRSRTGQEVRSRPRPIESGHRWVAAALFTFGLGVGLGLTPQIAQAQAGHATAVPAPTDPVPSTVTEVTLLTPASCAVEVIVDEDNPAPSTTLPGSCLLSAAHGEFPEVAGATGEVSTDLPATGSSMGLVAAIAASVLAAGAALWFVARKPRAF